jgi:hypothetical protein
MRAALILAFAALACVFSSAEANKGPKVTSKVYFDVTADGEVRRRERWGGSGGEMESIFRHWRGAHRQQRVSTKF